MLTLEFLKKRRSLILSCAKRHGVLSLRVFGSVSRGEADEASDVDLLVRFESDRSLLDQVALGQELASLLGASVDVVDETGLSPHLRTKVLEDAVPL